MKNLYVYTLESDKIEVEEIYNVMVKKDGDIIRKKDDYAYKNKGRYFVFHKSKEKVNEFDYHEYTQRSTEKEVAYVEYISFVPVEDLVQLKKDMIAFLEESIQKQIDRFNTSIDREIAYFIEKQEGKREKYINKKLILREETLAKFNGK